MRQNVQTPLSTQKSPIFVPKKGGVKGRLKLFRKFIRFDYCVKNNDFNRKGLFVSIFLSKVSITKTVPFGATLENSFQCKWCRKEHISTGGVKQTFVLSFYQEFQTNWFVRFVNMHHYVYRRPLFASYTSQHSEMRFDNKLTQAQFCPKSIYSNAR